MFSEWYYLVLGISLLLIQKTNKRRVQVGAFFLLLLLSPHIRYVSGVSVEPFYTVIGVMWCYIVIKTEDNKLRQYALVGLSLFGILLLYQPQWVKISLVEANIIVFFYDTIVDTWMKRRENKFAGYIKKLENRWVVDNRHIVRVPFLAKQRIEEQSVGSGEDEHAARDKS